MTVLLFAALPNCWDESVEEFKRTRILERIPENL